VIAFAFGFLAGMIITAFLLSVVTIGKMADLQTEASAWRARATTGFGDGE
jgi:hypothetical protein